MLEAWGTFVRNRCAGLLAVTLTSVAAIATANAADLAVEAPVYKAPVYKAPFFSWTGFYAGIQGGGGWGSESWQDNTDDGLTPSFKPSGGIFGGQAGYRWQTGPFVFGVEGTAAWADLKDTSTSPLEPASETFKIQSLYTATGQVGYAIDRWLPYVKAGWAGASTNLSLQNSAVPFTASQSEFNSGWTVGGGLDYAITNNIILGVEYDHYDLGFNNFTAAASNGATPLIATNASRLTIDAVVGRLNYKF
jgi:outer membrane immunogenic protein